MIGQRRAIVLQRFTETARYPRRHLRRGMEDQWRIVPEPRLGASMLDELRKHELRRAFFLRHFDPFLHSLTGVFVDHLGYVLDTDGLVPDLERPLGGIVGHVLAIR